MGVWGLTTFSEAQFNIFNTVTLPEPNNLCKIIQENPCILLGIQNSLVYFNLNVDKP